MEGEIEDGGGRCSEKRETVGSQQAIIDAMYKREDTGSKLDPAAILGQSRHKQEQG